MTKLLYMDHPHIYEISTTLISRGSDERGAYLIVAETVFYPQGGGQPADHGKIFLGDHSCDVYDVRCVEDDIRHYITQESVMKDPSHNTVTLRIDSGRRHVNTRYHTAGHLLASVTEYLFPHIKALKGHQFPGEAYIECEGMIEGNPLSILDTLQSALTQEIKKNTPVITKMVDKEDAKKLSAHFPYAQNKPLRVCDIGGFSPVPCGGTHVGSLGEIGTVRVISWKSKKEKTKIFYEIESTSPS